MLSLKHIDFLRSKTITGTNSDIIVNPFRHCYIQGNRPAVDLGGDFDSGQYKGVCEANEYRAGIPFTTRIGSAGNPAAILCYK